MGCSEGATSELKVSESRRWIIRDRWWSVRDKHADYAHR